MKKMKYVIALAAMIMGATASAALIVQDSFSTGNTADDYRTGSTFSTATNNNNKVITGTVGFRAVNPTGTYLWGGGSTALLPDSGKSLTHSGVQGTTAAGAAKISTVAGQAGSVARNARRRLDSPPAGSSFYMSGLVNMNGSLVNCTNANFAMGLGTNSAANNIFDIAVGMYLGVTADSAGNVYLAAFSGGNTYQLGSALTAAQATQTQMIVLKLDYGTGVGGLDTLTVWTAQQGATGLTQVLTDSTLNAGTSADLGLFVVQVKNDPIASSRAVYLDEFRFGTTLQDVTSIPEPATIGMLGLGGILVMLLRRIRYS